MTVELVTLLADMLRLDILPQIPAEGSVGASGDLTPLSYIAGALAGERQVLFGGEIMSSAQAFEKTGLKPIVLKPKEALAVMNGTAVMTGLAALAFQRAERLCLLSTRLTSMTSLALLGNPAPLRQASVRRQAPPRPDARRRPRPRRPHPVSTRPMRRRACRTAIRSLRSACHRRSGGHAAGPSAR